MGFVMVLSYSRRVGSTYGRPPAEIGAAQCSTSNLSGALDSAESMGQSYSRLLATHCIGVPVRERTTSQGPGIRSAGSWEFGTEREAARRALGA